MLDDLQSETDTSERLKLILDHFKCDSGAIHLLGEDGNLHLKANGPGMPDFVLEKIRVIPVGKGMAGLCVERNTPIDSCNLQQDTSGDVQPGAKQTGLQGSIVVPIRDSDGAAVGALGVGTKSERTFTEAEKTELIDCGMVLV